MAKSMAREKRTQSIDTEDHITERALEAAAWAQRHRRVVTASGIVLVAVVAAAFYYQDYRQKLVERGSVRLQEIQISSQSADMETIRSELRLFIDQFSGTGYANQARVVLADLELRRDSLGAAIRVLEPLADRGRGDPLSFSAIGMIAAAYDQGGDADRSLEWYERLENDALFDYQRHDAMAEQARLHTTAGRYEDAISLYERLVEEVEEDPAGLDVYAVRLGEVRTLSQFGVAPPVVIPRTDSQADDAEPAAEQSEAGEVDPAEQEAAATDEGSDP
jgi:predicted negative regulator of RcsB-dependent stress response